MGKDNTIHKPKRARRDVCLDEDDDWVTNLARQQTSSTSAHEATTTTKEERIQKRLAKKQRRENRLQTKRGHASSNITKESVSAVISTDLRQVGEETAARRTADATRLKINSSREQKDTKLLLRILARKIQECVDKKNHDAAADVAATSKDNAAAPRKRCRSKPYNYSPPTVPSSLHKKKKRRRQLAQVLQPRRSDYGGIGLARESLYIDLHDPSCTPQLEQEFNEHVPGFFGKQRTKAMKKQLDGNMLWRQLLQQKQQQQEMNSTSRKKKKSKNLSADGLVEGVLKSGKI